MNEPDGPSRDYFITRKEAIKISQEILANAEKERKEMLEREATTDSDLPEDLPKIIRFMSEVYNVEEIDSPGFCKAYDGHVSYSPRIITISTSARDKWETFFHELVHIVDETFNTKLDEHQVTLLGVGLAHIIRENFRLQNKNG